MMKKIKVSGEPKLNAFFSPAIRFFELEQSSGILLIAVAVIAIAWANSPFAGVYFELWEKTLSFGFGDFRLEKTLHHWINDGLMAVFFFVVGLEIKRELLIGEISGFKKAVLPVVAAIGGMIFPAAMYAVINSGTEASAGWGIPMATDIAFAIGVLSLLGKRVPVSLKVFLTALAIIDDLGAVIVIAVFYSSDISLLMLALSGLITLVLILMNLLKIRFPLVYMLFGLVLWFLFLKSGIHATIAGVVLAFTIPAKTRINARQFYDDVKSATKEIADNDLLKDENSVSPDVKEAVYYIEEKCENVSAPAYRLEHKLHPYVAFFIMPVFALANAGVSLGNAATGAFSGVTIGIFLGLVLGKITGITLLPWLSIKAGLGEMPRGSTFRHLFGAACLAGIGFTMSLFIANLAFGSSMLLEYSKLGIIAASLVSGFLGYMILRKSVSTTE
jgi:Na+:H+ antiporter, NhaA family